MSREARRCPWCRIELNSLKLLSDHLDKGCKVKLSEGIEAGAKYGKNRIQPVGYMHDGKMMMNIEIGDKVYYVNRWAVLKVMSGSRPYTRVFEAGKT